MGTADLGLPPPRLGQPMRRRPRGGLGRRCQRCGVQQRQRARHAAQQRRGVGHRQRLQQRRARSRRLPQRLRVGAVAQGLGHPWCIRIGQRELPEIVEAMLKLPGLAAPKSLAVQHLRRAAVSARQRVAQGGTLLRLVAQQLGAQRREFAALHSRRHSHRRPGQRALGLHRVQQGHQLRQAGVVRQGPDHHVQLGQVDQGLAERRPRESAAVLLPKERLGQAGAKHLRVQRLRADLAARQVADLQLEAQRDRTGVAAQRTAAARLAHAQAVDAQAAIGKTGQQALQRHAHRGEVSVGVGFQVETDRSDGGAARIVHPGVHAGSVSQAMAASTLPARAIDSASASMRCSTSRPP